MLAFLSLSLRVSGKEVHAAELFSSLLHAKDFPSSFKPCGVISQSSMINDRKEGRLVAQLRVRYSEKWLGGVGKRHCRGKRRTGEGKNEDVNGEE